LDKNQSGAELWRDICHELRKNLSKPSYATWIEPVGGARFDGKRLELLAHNPFAANWLRKNYQDLIRQLASGIAGPPVQVLIKDAPLGSQPSPQAGPGATPPAPGAPVADPPGTDPAHRAVTIGSSPCQGPTNGRGLNPRYLFSRFVVGGNSHMAHAACMAVAESTSKRFNPLFLCGNAGLGKTHLMQAIGHQRLQVKPQRLISRFSMGLVADIQSPDLETRMAILHKKADQDKVDLPEELIHYIACNFISNIRELEGALTRAVAYCSITSQPLSARAVAPVLNMPAEPTPVSPKQIIESVAQVCAVAAADLQGNGRNRIVSQARQMAMYLLRQHTSLSLGRIGQCFGRKDHTTVLYGIRRIRKALGNDPELAQQMAKVHNRLGI